MVADFTRMAREPLQMSTTARRASPRRARRWRGAARAGGLHAVSPVAASSDDAERVAAEGAELARDAGFDAEAYALQGKPKAWPTLLAKADAVDAAVVVIGSRGQGAVKFALLGSVSSGLLHHTRRPVLVVPPTEEDTPTGPALIAFDGSDASRAAITTASQLLTRWEAVVDTV